MDWISSSFWILSFFFALGVRYAFAYRCGTRAGLVGLQCNKSRLHHPEEEPTKSFSFEPRRHIHTQREKGHQLRSPLLFSYLFCFSLLTLFYLTIGIGGAASPIDEANQIGLWKSWKSLSWNVIVFYFPFLFVCLFFVFCFLLFCWIGLRRRWWVNSKREGLLIRSAPDSPKRNKNATILRFFRMRVVVFPSPPSSSLISFPPLSFKEKKKRTQKKRKKRINDNKRARNWTYKRDRCVALVRRIINVQGREGRERETVGR